VSTPDDTLDITRRLENLRSTCDQLYHALYEKNELIAELREEVERLRNTARIITDDETTP
jgi:predicted RNase H-like nuclease (RuvC/YqgF family)